MRKYFRKYYLNTVLLLLFFNFGTNSYCQAIHFSQYYNSPLLLNPANTALMPDNDFRIGLNYRNQWATVPVPYNTFDGFADFKIGGHKDPTHNSWLGLGIAFFSDQAGSGNLSLTQVQGSAAYHLRTGAHSMLSLGFSYAPVQRSVNFDKLTFDMQWDGLEFNPALPNGTKNGIVKDNYYTVGSGINFAVFPNDQLYMQFSGGAQNINQPTETFFNEKNKLAIMPMGDVDILIRTSNTLIVNPSMYYVTQSGASELLAGTLFRIYMSGGSNVGGTQMILGVFDRLNDAVIGVVGYQVGNIQFTASYDVTTSTLAPYNGSYGAIEFSIIYQSPYDRSNPSTRMYTCPRFF